MIEPDSALRRSLYDPPNARPDDEIVAEGQEKKDRDEPQLHNQNRRPFRWIRDRNPPLMQQQGPVNKSTAIIPQTTTRNRRAMARKSNVFCDANGSRLSIGTSTTDKKIIPPIQLIAATRWSHMRREGPIIRQTLQCGETVDQGRRRALRRLRATSLTAHENLPGNCFTNAVVSVSAMT
jgi:hypothetical protein